MDLYANMDGRVDYDQISDRTTVQDLLEAIDWFLSDNPLPCATCGDSCCKNTWAVEVDNVSVRRLCRGDDCRTDEFIRDKLVRQTNHIHDIEQYVLKKNGECLFVSETNLCLAYEQRPVICRLYLCNPKSYRYNVLREIIGCTFLSALVLEVEMRGQRQVWQKKRNQQENPAIYAGDYQVLLTDIFDYAQNEGWLDQDDRDLCLAGKRPAYLN